MLPVCPAWVAGSASMPRLPIAARVSLPLVAAVTALAVGCGGAVTAPTAPSAVLSLGAAPQTGAPAPAADPLPGVSALGATTFLAFGDSITCGVPGAFSQNDIAFDAALDSTCTYTGYPETLQSLLGQASPTQAFTVWNEGRPGEEAALAYSRLSTNLAARRPQVVLLLEGVNDLNSGRSIPSIVSALQQMVELSRAYNATVFVGTMFQTCYSVNPYTGRVRTNSTDRIVPFNNAVRAMVAGRLNVYLADIYGAFGTGNCGVDKGINRVGEDGLHPSPSGYATIATTFGLAARDALAIRGSVQ